MPLSEHEQKLLDQLEQQLNAEDPTFVHSMDSESSSSPRNRSGLSVRHLVLGIVIAVLGLAGVLVGVASKLIIVGVLGFVIMGLGVYIASLRSTSRKGRKKSSGSGGSQHSPSSGSSFMQRLEKKWEERDGRG
ncbi:DUF3040 domain-containing protein [Kocuria massiliensis]|uniref:DUF3040 domain-containing protein n=1 Tax=Kocuria massiliensis TaxID=1926282 RepID=UPI0022B9632A|nr:DUF3040 domain-containing protein [Kocuria massiliensis]